METKNLVPNPKLVTSPRKSAWLQKLEAKSGHSVELPTFRSVYLLIDCSGSMDQGGKMEAAKVGAIGFASNAIQKSYSVGVASFGSIASNLLSPSRSVDNIRDAIARLGIKGSTNLAAGIELAVESFRKCRGERVICVVTDGMPDNEGAALQAAAEASASGIDIMTIGTDDADESFLARLATRRELFMKVERRLLQTSLSEMSRLLPGS